MSENTNDQTTTYQQAVAVLDDGPVPGAEVLVESFDNWQTVRVSIRRYPGASWSRFGQADVVTVG